VRVPPGGGGGGSRGGGSRVTIHGTGGRIQRRGRRKRQGDGRRWGGGGAKMRSAAHMKKKHHWNYLCWITSWEMQFASESAAVSLGGCERRLAGGRHQPLDEVDRLCPQGVDPRARRRVRGYLPRGHSSPPPLPPEGSIGRGRPSEENSGTAPLIVRPMQCGFPRSGCLGMDLVHRGTRKKEKGR